MFNLFRSQTSLLRSLCRYSMSKLQRQQHLTSLLSRGISHSKVRVEDISEGASCGLMYNIYVESQSFYGKPLVQQHQMVTKALKQELKTIHAINIVTKAIPIHKTPHTSKPEKETKHSHPHVNKDKATRGGSKQDGGVGGGD